MTKPATKAPPLRAEQLRALLSARHGFTTTQSSAPQEWALFFELRNGTGYASERAQYLDAFAVNTWPSKKLWRVAYEIKVSRADFLKELAQPQKRQWGVDISNEFWFVCAPGVATKEEIPEECGFLECDAKATKLKRVVAAKQRKARALTDAEIAAIARQSFDSTLLHSLKWSYAGAELDYPALDALLEERKDAFLAKQIAAGVEKQLERDRKLIADQLFRYAIQLKAAGVKPPAWMENWQPGLPQHWDAASWGKQVALPTPELQRLDELRSTLRAAEAQVQTAMSRIEEARGRFEAVFKPVDHEQSGEGMPIPVEPPKSR